MKTVHNLAEVALLLFMLAWLVFVFAWHAAELRALPGPLAFVVGLAAYLLPVWLATWSYARWRDRRLAAAKESRRPTHL